MSDDRRTSVRRRAELPFAWRNSVAGATTVELCRTLGIPVALALQSRLADLDEHFQSAAGSVTDSRVAEALRALDGKLEVLEEALLAQAPVPPPAPLDLSADGLAFEAPEALAEGSWIAVHVVLPTAYHLVGLAQVSHCAAPHGDATGYRIGAGFHGLEDPVARRLTRFAISRDQVP